MLPTTTTTTYCCYLLMRAYYVLALSSAESLWSYFALKIHQSWRYTGHDMTSLKLLSVYWQFTLQQLRQYLALLMVMALVGSITCWTAVCTQAWKQQASQLGKVNNLKTHVDDCSLRTDSKMLHQISRYLLYPQTTHSFSHTMFLTSEVPQSSTSSSQVLKQLAIPIENSALSCPHLPGPKESTNEIHSHYKLSP